MYKMKLVSQRVTDWVNDWLTDGLQELLELLFATKSFLKHFYSQLDLVLDLFPWIQLQNGTALSPVTGAVGVILPCNSSSDVAVPLI